MTTEAFFTAIGSNGYRGSSAEQEDRAVGLKRGGKCIWLAGDKPVCDILDVQIDDDGDPWFLIGNMHDGSDHKNIWARRNEISAQ